MKHQLYRPVLSLHVCTLANHNMTDILGFGVSELAQAQEEVAELYEALGDFQNSIEARQRAIDMFSEVLGRHHHLVTVRYNQLAVLYSKLNRHNEAVQCVRDRLDLPANHGCILPPPMTPDDFLDMYFIET